MPHSYTWAALPGLLALAGTTWAQPAAFGPVTQYDIGPNKKPNSVLVVDINGDNKPDIITANTFGHSAGVLLGTGSGSFSPVMLFGTGADSGPVDVAVADVDGNGWPDIVTANASNSTVGVFLNAGGNFNTVTTFSTGVNSRPFGIAVADVSGDGKPDIITANFGTSEVGVLFGTGAGNFSAATTFSAGVGSQPYDVAVADVNNDGKLDLLTANYNTKSVGMLVGAGTGSFDTVVQLNAGGNNVFNVCSIVVADVNHDGRPDLLTANDYAAGTVSVLLSTGGGSFGAATTFTSGVRSTVALAVADMNGDGNLDILAADFVNHTAGVLPGTGSGSFGSLTTLDPGMGSSPRSIAAADLNGDGRLDLVTANYFNGAAEVLLNTGTYTPLAAATGLAAATVALYPNPAQGRVQVAVPAVAGATAVQATLLDALGRVVRQQTAALPATGTTLTLDAAGLAAGVYTLRLAAGAAVLARRVVLE